MRLTHIHARDRKTVTALHGLKATLYDREKHADAIPLPARNKIDDEE
jgi:hypothetical protein